MITPKHATLRDILASKGGLHLTAYVRAGGDPAETRLKLGRVLYCAINQMYQCTSAGSRREFLSPLISLLRDNRRLEMLPRRFAVFRNETSFRILHLPHEVEEQCFVADSFHVKPLLGWIQAEDELLILSLEDANAALYAGSRGQLRLVAEHFSRPLGGATGTRSRKLRRARAEWAEETAAWLEEQLRSLPRGHRPRLYLLGGEASSQLLAHHLRYRNLDLSLARLRIADMSLPAIWALLQKRLSEETERRLSRTISEFERAEQASGGRRNLFEIASAAARGRVEKLLVASDLQIFGKVNRATGALQITGADVDHEDDDVLDDIAQLVLAKGGKVHVVPSARIPAARPAIALLKPARMDPAWPPPAA